MKNIIFTLVTGIFLSVASSAQTAVNFNCNDCMGTNHDLFTELDAGNVIVLTWVMPCGSCINVASTVANTVQGYATTNPGIVKYYLVDDYANSSCAQLSNWASTNSINVDAKFSNSTIRMSDYGSADMQKTIVLGGSSHSVFYNVLGTVAVPALQAAINSAMATGITENKKNISAVSLFPNPVKGNRISLNYSLTQNSNVSVEIYNMLGAQVKFISCPNMSVGKNELNVDLSDFLNGLYFVRLQSGASIQTVKFCVAN